MGGQLLQSEVAVYAGFDNVKSVLWHGIIPSKTWFSRIQKMQT